VKQDEPTIEDEQGPQSMVIVRVSADEGGGFVWGVGRVKLRPFRPFRPLKPFRPFNPFNPLSPLSPLSPFNPLRPFNPLNPFVLNPFKFAPEVEPPFGPAFC